MSLFNSDFYDEEYLAFQSHAEEVNDDVLSEYLGDAISTVSQESHNSQELIHDKISEFVRRNFYSPPSVHKPSITVTKSTKKKKTRYPKFVALPKVLKKDIRRSFVEMFTLVQNSNCFTLLEGFYKHFATNNITMELNGSGFIMKCAGLSNYLQFMYVRSLIDQCGTHQLTDATLHTFPNSEESYLRAKFIFTTTLFLELPNGLHDSQLSNTPPADSNNAPRKRTKHNDDSIDKQQGIIYDTSVADVVRRARLLPTPMKLVVTGYSTIHFNGNNQITRLESVTETTSTTPFQM